MHLQSTGGLLLHSKIPYLVRHGRCLDQRHAWRSWSSVSLLTSAYNRISCSRSPMTLMWVVLRLRTALVLIYLKRNNLLAQLNPSSVQAGYAPSRLWHQVGAGCYFYGELVTFSWLCMAEDHSFYNCTTRSNSFDIHRLTQLTGTT